MNGSDSSTPTSFVSDDAALAYVDWASASLCKANGVRKDVDRERSLAASSFYLCVDLKVYFHW